MEYENYRGVQFMKSIGSDKARCYCPFDCGYQSEVNVGSFPEVDLRMAIGWMRHHLESAHAKYLDAKTPANAALPPGESEEKAPPAGEAGGAKDEEV